MPSEGFATGRTSKAYTVPDVKPMDGAKVTVKLGVPAEKPGIVAVVRSAPVGSPPLVLRIETVRLGVVPVHPLQKIWIVSAWTSVPVTPAVNV